MWRTEQWGFRMSQQHQKEEQQSDRVTTETVEIYTVYSIESHYCTYCENFTFFPRTSNGEIHGNIISSTGASINSTFRLSFIKDSTVSGLFIYGFVLTLERKCVVSSADHRSRAHEYSLLTLEAVKHTMY